MRAAEHFHPLTSDSEASTLMPGGQHEPHVVVFCRPRAEVLSCAAAFVDAAPVPDAWRLVTIDPRSARETARWFGLDATPAMAVVCRGAILAIEQECSPEAFARLIEVARRRQDILESL